MTLTDKAVGGSLLLSALLILAYYTAWVVVTPFVDADSPIQGYFPERKFAILIPTVAFVGAVTVAGTLVGLVMVRTAAAKRKSA